MVEIRENAKKALISQNSEKAQNHGFGGFYLGGCTYPNDLNFDIRTS